MERQQQQHHHHRKWPPTTTALSPSTMDSLCSRALLSVDSAPRASCDDDPRTGDDARQTLGFGDSPAAPGRPAASRVLLKQRRIERVIFCFPLFFFHFSFFCFHSDDRRVFGGRIDNSSSLSCLSLSRTESDGHKRCSIPSSFSWSQNGGSD